MDIRNVDKNDVSTVKNFLKCCNIINACLLCASGIFSFSNLLVFNFTAFFAGFYVIFFGVLMCCFEIHLKKFDRYVFLNFGFMFYWKWRSLFFFFVGSMVFALGGVFATITAGVTILNVLFNAYVLAMHPGYKAYVAEEQRIHRHDAQGAEMEDLDTGNGFDQLSHIAGVASGQENASFQDARDAAKFYKTHKKEVNQAAAFYGEHKEEVDAAAKVAYKNKDEIKKAHDTFF